MEIDTEHCGWYIRRYVDEPLPQSVIIYRDSDPTKKEAIGIGGEKALNEGKAAESIDLSQMFELFKEDPAYNGTVYFLADQKQTDELGDNSYSWSATRPSHAIGNCSFYTAFIIYDTDAARKLQASKFKAKTSRTVGRQKSVKTEMGAETCISVQKFMLHSALAKG